MIQCFHCVSAEVNAYAPIVTENKNILEDVKKVKKKKQKTNESCQQWAQLPRSKGSLMITIHSH